MELKEIVCKKNVGSTDRRIRMAIGAVVCIGGLLLEQKFMGVVGFIVFISGLRGNCPIYSVCKHSTIEK